MRRRPPIGPVLLSLLIAGALFVACVEVARGDPVSDCKKQCGNAARGCRDEARTKYGGCAKDCARDAPPGQFDACEKQCDATKKSELASCEATLESCTRGCNQRSAVDACNVAWGAQLDRCEGRCRGVRHILEANARYWRCVESPVAGAEGPKCGGLGKPPCFPKPKPVPRPGPKSVTLAAHRQGGNDER